MLRHLGRMAKVSHPVLDHLHMAFPFMPRRDFRLPGNSSTGLTSPAWTGLRLGSALAKEGGKLDGVQNNISV